MSTAVTTSFDPTSIAVFRFTHRSLEADGTVRLGYALDGLEFEETFKLPTPAATPPRSGKVLLNNSFPLLDAQQVTIDGILDLLHWTAGVSYYKAAIPSRIAFEGNQPGPATRALLAALYSEGLGEFAVVNDLPGLPSPDFRGSSFTTYGCETRPAPTRPAPAPAARPVASLLVPVGGGKDSAVAIEIARASGLPTTLFSVGDATPIRSTAEVSGYPRLKVTRQLDPRLLELNAAGALNGHVPITAIVSAAALLTAALNDVDAVTLANERSASAGNLTWHGIEVNHQFSKSLRAERLFAAAAQEIPDAPRIFSVLRPASELGIARAFSRCGQYHPVFTSCNRVFKLDPAERAGSWCCDCDKCRFVYLILAPFTTPDQLKAIFGKDLLADPGQYQGFAVLTATGGDKPFECVGEVDECLAAIRLLSESPEWRAHTVVQELATSIPRVKAVTDADIQMHFALSDDHAVPAELIGPVSEVLGA